MRNNIWVCLLVCLGLCSCYETYPGLSMDMSGDDIDWGEEYEPDSVLVEKERLPIILSMIDPSFTSLSRTATRGMGAFDADRADSLREAMWDAARFYVFGLRQGGAADFTKTHATDSVTCLVDNAPTRVPDRGSMMMTFEDDEAGASAKHMYSNRDSLVRYNFYAYYMDDLDNSGLTRTKDSIYVPFTIDGSQDLLAGMARLTKKQVATMKATPELPLMKYYYSTYTAQKGLFPVVDMNHQLARLKFFIYPADAGCDSIKIEKIEVQVPNTGRLVVAHKKADRVRAVFDAETAWLSLHDEGNVAQLDSNKYCVSYLEAEKDLPIYERSSKQVGESLLLPPAKSYHVRVTARVDGDSPLARRYETEYDVTYSDLFKPNYEYKIRLALYGPTELTVSAQLQGWQAGGDVFIDEDELFDEFNY